MKTFFALTGVFIELFVAFCIAIPCVLLAGLFWKEDDYNEHL